MKRLPQADHILILNDNGRLVEQGTFAELNVAGSYIHDLQIKVDENPSHDGVEEDINNIIDSTDALIQASAAAGDRTRKTGDWSIYKYYVQALGPWGMIMFGCLVAGNETFVGMGSESSELLQKASLIRCKLRHLAQLVGRKQRERRQLESWLLARVVWLHELHGGGTHGQRNCVSSVHHL